MQPTEASPSITLRAQAAALIHIDEHDRHRRMCRSNAASAWPSPTARSSPARRYPACEQLAQRLGVSPTTVGRAYADLSREGVIVARAGGGSAIASLEQLDHPALRRTRLERRSILARQAVVRGLALGLDASEIIAALKRELALHEHPVPASVAPEPLGSAEVALLSARNRWRGRVSSIRAGEVLAELTLDVASVQVVAAMLVLPRVGRHSRRARLTSRGVRLSAPHCQSEPTAGSPPRRSRSDKKLVARVAPAS